MLASRLDELYLEDDVVNRSAVRNGWAEIATRDPNMRSFVREGLEHGRGERLNWYTSTGTVGTCLQHPSRAAPTQLFRRGLDSEGVQQLLVDPRRHTGIGYYRRSQDPHTGPRVSARGSRWSDSDGQSEGWRDSDDEDHRRSSSPSQGELLASFGGDVELLTDYHCGLVDSDGEPTDYAQHDGAEAEQDSEGSDADHLESADEHQEHDDDVRDDGSDCGGHAWGSDSEGGGSIGGGANSSDEGAYSCGGGDYSSGDASAGSDDCYW